MQSILRWSLENSTPLDSAPSDRPPVERKDLDPAIIDMILGKPDAVQMKEDMAVAVDSSKSEDERVDALDHLEMLVEHIDNANDLEKLKLWEPLQSLLTAESSTAEIKTQALWVIGTALQNNPSAQDVYLAYKPLPTLLSFLDASQSSSASTRAKAIYTISGLLKHNARAVEALDKDGWTRLRESLQDPAISVRRKVVFLLGTLLIPSSNLTNQPAPPTTLRIADDPDSSSSSTAPTANIVTPDNRPAPVDEPIHANSHAAQLQHPSRSNTSQPTLKAFSEYNLLDSIISSVISPVPYGEDGENIDSDADYEEKAIHLLYTYTVTCQGELSPAHKNTLKVWVQAEKVKEGEKVLLGRWNLPREEYTALIQKIL